MRSSAGLDESYPHPWSQTVAPTVAGFGVAVTEALRSGLGLGLPARTGAVASAARTTTAAIVTSRIKVTLPFNEGCGMRALSVPYRRIGRFTRSLSRWNLPPSEARSLTAEPQYECVPDRRFADRCP